jgi:hypothetical protein
VRICLWVERFRGWFVLRDVVWGGSVLRCLSHILRVY